MNFNLPVYPADNGVCIHFPREQVYAVDLALSGISTIIHIPHWPSAVAVMGAKPASLMNPDSVTLSNNRSIRATKIEAVFWPTARKDVIRFRLQQVQADFDLFPGDDDLDELYSSITEMIRSVEGPNLPSLDDLQVIPQ